MVQTDYLILGCGLTGSLIARMLNEHGKNVHVIDKGRGVGGRVASRRRGTTAESVVHFNHGVSNFSAKQILSSSWFEKLIEEKILEVSDDENVFALPLPATDMIKFLLRGVPITLNEKVTTVQTSNGKWDLLTESGHLFRGRLLVMTPPLPQSLNLIRPLLTESLAKEMDAVAYTKSMVLIATVDSEQAERLQTFMPEFLLRFQVEERKNRTSVMMELKPELADKFFDENDEKIAENLREIFDDIILQDLDIKRWRYARVAKSLPYPCLQFSDRPRGLIAGDAFGSMDHQDFERAWISAETLVQDLLA